jgi:uroporphyrinogen decarboxylase
VQALEQRPAAEAVPFVAQAIRMLRQELDGRTPVIGFCGAPFTLAAYLVQGEGKEGFGAAKTMMYRDPQLLETLLAKLTETMTDYLRLQVLAGAQALQIFDSWVGLLAPADYERCALRWVRQIVAGVKDLNVPVIYFVNGAPHLLEAATTAGSDVLGICWRTPIDQAAARVGSQVALQGNLDPHALFAEPAEVSRLASDVLGRMAGRPGHIMNLGHGILPGTPIESVEALVAAVQHTGRGASYASTPCPT